MPQLPCDQLRFCLKDYVIVSMTVLLILFSANWAAAGTIIGTVTDAQTGEAISALTMEIINCYFDLRVSTSTDSNGNYRFEELPAGQYLALAEPGISGYVPGYYKNAANYYTASFIDLKASQELWGVDFELTAGQSLSGTVSHEDQDSPPTGVAVFACREGMFELSQQFLEESPDKFRFFLQGGCAVTDQNGDYTIHGLAPGRYIVGTAPYRGNAECLPYIAAFFGNSHSSIMAQLVPVTSSEGASGIDITLKSGGDIGGAVLNQNGKGVQNIMIRAEGLNPWLPAFDEASLPGGVALTDPNGRYKIWGLPGGSYRVYPCIKGYSASFTTSSTGASGNSPALSVNVVEKLSTSGCDFILPEEAKISGSVFSAIEGAPIKGALLTITPVAANESYGYGYSYGYGGSYYSAGRSDQTFGLSQILTDAVGGYTFSGLDRGAYFVRAAAPGLRGPFNRYLSRVYGSAGRSMPIYALASDETSGIDFYLNPGGSISGRVLKKTNGLPFPGIQVRASYRGYFPGQQTQSVSKFSFTDETGGYRIEGLPEGPYVVCAGEKISSTFAPDLSSLASLAGQGYIMPASDSENFSNYSSSLNNPKGSDIYGRCVWVTPPQDTVDIDFELIKDGAVSGRVFAADTNQPLAGAGIVAVKLLFSSNQSQGGTLAGANLNPGYPMAVYSAKTDMHGDYIIHGVREGEYQIMALDHAVRYMPSPYRVIAVMQGEVVENQNFSLALGGIITGRIVDEIDNSPIPNVMVNTHRLYGTGTGNYGYSSYSYAYAHGSSPYGYAYPGAVTDANGEYTITGLSPAEYIIQSTQKTGEYLSEYYQDVQADSLSGGETFTELTRDLTTLGSIYPNLQIRYQNIYSLIMELVLRDKNGRQAPVLLKLSSDEYQGMGIYFGPEWRYECPLGYSSDKALSNLRCKNSWYILELNLEVLLARYFLSKGYSGEEGLTSEGLDSLVSISLRGNGYLIDCIRLYQSVPDSATDFFFSYIDGFNYSQMPAEHGWLVTSPKTPNITMLSGDHLEGGGGIRVLAGIPVAVNEGDRISNIDMALAGGSSISGQVMCAEDNRSLAGISVFLYNLDGSQKFYYEPPQATTDSRGNYTINGLNPGAYVLMARDERAGLFLDQWYDNKTPPIGWWWSPRTPDYVSKDLPYFSGISKSDLTGFTNRNLEFFIKNSLPFSLTLDVLTTSGKQAGLKFYHGDNTYSNDNVTRISDVILVRLSNSDSTYGRNFTWEKYQYNIDDLLDNYLSTHLDRVVGVSLKGCHYLIDYVKLTQNGMEDQVIDEFDYFDYFDSPTNHGWVNHYPESAGLAAIFDPELGRSCLLITGATPVTVSGGADIEEINFSLKSGESISGTVMEKEDNSPVSGIEVKVSPSSPREGYSLNSSIIKTVTNESGHYNISGLLPGDYKVETYDPQGYYQDMIYKDIPSPNQYLPILTKDLSASFVNNPTLLFEFIHKKEFAFKADCELTDGSAIGLIFNKYSTKTYEWPDQNIPTFTFPLLQNISSQGTSYQGLVREDQWISFTCDLNVFISQKFPDLGLKRVKRISLAGSSFKISSIKFVGETAPEQIVDDFNYSDSIENHGWVMANPEVATISLMMDPLLDMRVLRCLETKMVTVAEGAQTRGVDFHLSRGNIIMGQVTDATDNSPLAGIKVWVVREYEYSHPDGSTTISYGYSQYQMDYTDRNGYFAIVMRPSSDDAVKYRIKAKDEAKNIYLEATHPEALNLTSGPVVPDINIALIKGGSIKGRVVYQDSNTPAELVTVYCETSVYYSAGYSQNSQNQDPNHEVAGDDDDDDDDEEEEEEEEETTTNNGPLYPYPVSYKTVTYGRTNSAGYFCLTGIPEGGYVIHAGSIEGMYAGYYKDNRDYLDPPVALASGEALEGIDISLNLILSKDTYYTYSFAYQKTGDLLSSSANSYAGLSSAGNSGSSNLYGGLGSSGNLSGQGGYASSSSGQTQGNANDQQGSGASDQSSENSPGAPSINSRPSLTATAGELYSYQITLKDPNSRIELNFSLIKAPSGMTIDPDSRLITWMPAAEQSGAHMVTVGVNAPQGGVARQSFVIKVLPHMIIENAEEQTQSPLLNGEWCVVNGTGTVVSVEDQALAGNVLSTQTEEQDPLNFRIRYPGPDNFYSLQNPRPYLSFAVRADNDFCFRVGVRADGQDYILSYAPMDGNCVVSGLTITCPVKTECKNGQWHLSKRDLQKDLDPLGVTFEWVDYFEIWGDCRLDDLWLSYQPIDYQILSVKLYPGLNLINFPVRLKNLNSQSLAQSLKKDASEALKIKRRNTFRQRWEDNFDYIRDDQGIILYSSKEKWVTFKGSEKNLKSKTLASFLKAGVNLIAPPTQAGEPYHDLLKDLKSFNPNIQGIQGYDELRGTWKFKTNFFGHSAGTNFKIQPEDAFIVHLDKE